MAKEVNSGIGEIYSVSQERISCRLFNITELRYISDSSFVTFQGINDFILSKNQNSEYILFKVSSVYSKEIDYSNTSDKKQNIDYSNPYKKENKYFIDAVPIGEWVDGEFKFGTRTYPIIGKIVELSSPFILNSIFNNFDNDTDLSMNIGYLNGNRNVTPKLKLDIFFGNHFCIFGNTGSGKSTSTRFFLRNFISKVSTTKETIPNVIIFDVHNEYGNFIDNILDGNTVVKYNFKSEVSIDPKEIVLESWFSILQAAPLVQQPIVEQALRISKILKDNRKKKQFIAHVIHGIFIYQPEAVAKSQKIKHLYDIYLMGSSTSLDSAMKKYNPTYGNFPSDVDQEKFVNSLKNILSDFNISEELNSVEPILDDLSKLPGYIDMSLLLEESNGNNQVRSQCQTLQTRVSNITKKYSKNIFDVKNERKLKSYRSIIDEDKIFILNVNDIDDEDLNFISSCLLDRKYLQKKENRKPGVDLKRTLFIFDEAHRYINKQNDYNNIKSFERVSREGRKFGISLGSISQRPSELSEVVMSQSSNFIIHRIRNSEDLKKIKDDNPFIDIGSISRIPLLIPGDAIILGDCVPFSIETSIYAEEQDSKISSTDKLVF